MPKCIQKYFALSQIFRIFKMWRMLMLECLSQSFELSKISPKSWVMADKFEQIGHYLDNRAMSLKEVKCRCRINPKL